MTANREPPVEPYDVIVVGSGPGGQKAAVQAAKVGQRVLVVERERRVGGCCVRTGTIPSKTLRETAVYLSGLRERNGGVFDVPLPADLRLCSLMTRLDAVVDAQQRCIGNQLDRNGIETWRGIAKFVDPHTLAVTAVRGEVRHARGDHIVIATGSVPRTPSDVFVDHEHVLDSDSILSIEYLPASLTVLGGGVISCEYASIFAALGVPTAIVDRGPRPLAFLDPELSEAFVAHFERQPGCRYLGEQRLASVEFDGFRTVVTRLESGEEIASEKVLFTLGRVANLGSLEIAAAGLETTDRGLLSVDEHCRTSVPHIYAVGDVIGAPGLASAAAEQGRRAMRHALGLPVGPGPETIPAGIYTIPEIASVGWTEAEARERFGAVRVGRADFGELARGQISCCTDGFLKLVTDAEGVRLLGAQVFGEGATELIHLAQLGLRSGQTVEDTFVESIFNFPTLAEAFRVAALDVLRQASEPTPATAAPG